MSGHTKGHRTKIPDDLLYKVVIIGPGRKNLQESLVPVKYLVKLETFLQKYGQGESTPWRKLAAERIVKHKKSGIALRGARYREGISQKELAMRSGVSQENISRLENGQRVIGDKVAKKLAKALHIDFHLLLESE